MQLEDGIYKPLSIPIGERLCISCEQLEDEFHFVLQSEAYNYLRIQYIPSYYRLRPSMYKSLCCSKTTIQMFVEIWGISCSMDGQRSDLVQMKTQQLYHLYLYLFVTRAARALTVLRMYEFKVMSMETYRKAYV